jgi:hypothetical protein
VSIRIAAAVAACVAIVATALPAGAAPAAVTVVGPAGSWAVVDVPRGKSIPLSDIDFGATFEGAATGTFIRPLDRPGARPGDARTFFGFFAAPPTNPKRYVAEGEGGADPRPLAEQRLSAGRYVVFLLGTQTARIRFPGIGSRTVRAAYRMRHRFASGDVRGASTVSGWSGRVDDAYDLSGGTVVATSAELRLDADVAAWHHCFGPSTMERCPAPGPVDRDVRTGGRGNRWILDPRVDPVRGHVLTTYDGLRQPDVAWRSFLSFDASAGQRT